MQLQHISTSKNGARDIEITSPKKNKCPSFPLPSLGARLTVVHNPVDRINNSMPFSTLTLYVYPRSETLLEQTCSPISIAILLLRVRLGVSSSNKGTDH